MIKIENHCVNCGLPCRGASCLLQKVEVHYCDECGDELDEIYDVDGDELCEYCLIDRFKVVRYAT